LADRVPVDPEEHVGVTPRGDVRQLSGLAVDRDLGVRGDGVRAPRNIGRRLLVEGDRALLDIDRLDQTSAAPAQVRPIGTEVAGPAKRLSSTSAPAGNRASVPVVPSISMVASTATVYMSSPSRCATRSVPFSTSAALATPLLLVGSGSAAFASLGICLSVGGG